MWHSPKAPFCSPILILKKPRNPRNETQLSPLLPPPAPGPRPPAPAPAPAVFIVFTPVRSGASTRSPSCHAPRGRSGTAEQCCPPAGRLHELHEDQDGGREEERDEIFSQNDIHGLFRNTKKCAHPFPFIFFSVHFFKKGKKENPGEAGGGSSSSELAHQVKRLFDTYRRWSLEARRWVTRRAYQ